jgi:(p)ppGpp synthase/HD superfamily hydrolase
MIDQAIEFAAKAHCNQLRKGTDIPYISHPYAVGIILLQSGCREEVVVAGILHDTIEDAATSVEEIRNMFGPEVAAIVEGCSEPEHETLSWEERKEHTLEYLSTAPGEVKIVACADKLHNIRTIATQYRQIGDQVWTRFKRGRDKQEWYYRGLVRSLGNQPDLPGYGKIYDRFKAEVENLFT